MAYQSQQNSPKAKVNTDGLQLYGTDSTMKLDFWNQHVTCKIHPVKDENDTVTKGVYNYKVKTSLTITPDTAIVFGNLINDIIIPASKNNEAKHIGLQTSKVNIIYCSNGIEETGSFSPYIALFVNIDESRIPKEVGIFHFQQRRIFNSYDAKTGEFSMEETTMHDLQMIANFFMNAVQLTGAGAHAIDCEHAYDMERDEQFFAGIGSKLGVTYQQPVNYVNRAAMQRDPWGGQSAANTDSSQQQQNPVNNISTASMDSLNDLLGSRIIKDVKGLKKHLLNGDKLRRKNIKFITY